MNGRENLKCSGATTVAGGVYDQVSTSGALRSSGSIDCMSLHSSGATKIAGDLICAGEVSGSGAIRVNGRIQTGSLHSSGSVHAEAGLICAGEARLNGGLGCGGDIHADCLRCNGSAMSAGVVRVREAHVSGKLEAAGVEAEIFRSSGKLMIRGLLNAEDAELSIGGRIEVGDIGGSRIVVHRERVIGFSFSRPELCVKSIEGDTIELEYTKAQVVRGRYVRIGAGCEIGRVEYSEDLTVEGGKVAQEVKL